MSDQAACFRRPDRCLAEIITSGPDVDAVPVRQLHPKPVRPEPGLGLSILASPPAQHPAADLPSPRGSGLAILSSMSQDLPRRLSPQDGMMSEYQYYDFLAVDRPLNPDQMARLREVSTRAVITPTSFTNTYHWGNLHADPRELVKRYFDAFLYTSNWGTRRLIFRVPQRLLTLETARQYCQFEVASVSANGSHLVIELCCGPEYGGEEYDGDWDEDDSGEGRLGSVISARADLMTGDLRLLYLGWLLSADLGMLDDEELEPPVPPNLADLSGALHGVVKFLKLDPDLVAAAAEQSAQVESNPANQRQWAAWIGRLPAKDKDTLLLRVISGDETFVRADLQRQFADSQERPSPLPDDPEARSVGELLYRAAQLRRDREHAEAEERARAVAQSRLEAATRHAHRLETLAAQGEQAWQQVSTLVAAAKPREYDSAVKLLLDLRDLSARDGTTPDFNRRILGLRSLHANRPALLRRFEAAGFVS